MARAWRPTVGAGLPRTLGAAIAAIFTPTIMKSKHTLPPWLRPKTPTPKLAVGVAWYTEDEWAKVKAAAADAERFESTYAEWIQMASESLANLRATGIIAEKTYVNADAFLAWCMAHNKPNDGASRAEFVSEQGRTASGSGA